MKSYAPELGSQDGDGLVSMEEFIGCQTILQNSLGLKSKVSLEEQFKKEFGKSATTSVPLLDSRSLLRRGVWLRNPNPSGPSLRWMQTRHCLQRVA